MITTTYIDNKEDFVELAKKQDWLESDMFEARELGVKDIPTTFKLMQSNFLKMCVVKNNDDVIALIALQFDNQLVYFNTNAVRSCLKSYLKFLKDFVDSYVKERTYLTVKAINSYTTTNKKLKYLGFRKVHIRFRDTTWMVYNGW